MRPSIKDQLKKAGIKPSSEEPPKEINLVTGEVETEMWVSSRDVIAPYHPPSKKRPHRHRYGKVKITEVKKQMEKRLYNKEAITYKMLDIFLQYPNTPIPVRLLTKNLPENTKKTTILSGLVKFTQAGVVSAEVKEGVKHYGIREADRKLGADALYVKYLDYLSTVRKPRNNIRGKLTDVTKKTPAPAAPGINIPSTIEIKISGTVEHIFTFRLGR